jgi:hypothetical protein
MKRYADNPLQVRLYPLQEEIMDKIVSDTTYCNEHNIDSKSDIVRRSLNNVLKHYEQTCSSR